MKHKIKLVALVSVLISIKPFQVLADKTIWPAIQVDNEIVTSYEVEQYIESVLITPELKSTLFSQVNQNYQSYRDQIEKIKNDLFVPGLQRMAIIRILQAQSLRNEGRQFFKITKQDLKQSIERQIQITLSPYLKQNSMNLELAKSQFVEDLKKGLFPYSSTESSSAIFNNWVAQLTIQMTESYRNKEALRYLCSVGDCEYNSFFDIFKRIVKKSKYELFVSINYTADKKLTLTDATDTLLKFNGDQNSFEVVVEKPEIEKTVSKHFYLGQIVNSHVELIHMNDWNLTGPVGEKLGYPKTDDYGRTSGFLLTYQQEGTNGSVTVQLENWLFSEKVGVDQQKITEENTLRIVSRQFLDEKGNTWVAVGVSATGRIDEASIGAWIQKNFHQLNSSSHPRENIGGDSAEAYLQGLFGVGGKYSIVDTKHIDLVLSGEVMLAPTVGVASQNSLNLSSSLDLNIYGKNEKLPIFQIGIFGQARLRVNGDLETAIGGHVSVAFAIKRVQIQLGLFIVVWDQELDRVYEGQESWTTGISISVNILPKKNLKDYAFN